MSFLGLGFLLEGPQGLWSCQTRLCRDLFGHLHGQGSYHTFGDLLQSGTIFIMKNHFLLSRKDFPHYSLCLLPSALLCCTPRQSLPASSPPPFGQLEIAVRRLLFSSEGQPSPVSASHQTCCTAGPDQLNAPLSIPPPILVAISQGISCTVEPQSGPFPAVALPQVLLELPFMNPDQAAVVACCLQHSLLPTGQPCGMGLTYPGARICSRLG